MATTRFQVNMTAWFKYDDQGNLTGSGFRTQYVDQTNNSIIDWPSDQGHFVHVLTANLAKRHVQHGTESPTSNST